MKLPKKLYLAACLVQVLGLKTLPSFDFSASCHSFTPCLIVLESDSNQTHILQLPYPDYSFENYLTKCALALSVELEALTLQEIIQLKSQ